MLLGVYSCQNATLLEITCRGSIMKTHTWVKNACSVNIMVSITSFKSSETICLRGSDQVSMLYNFFMLNSTEH